MLTQIFAGLTALFLVVVFVLEVFFHHRRELYSFTLIEPEDVPAVRMWAINTGFYNLTYGLGLFTGLILLHTPWVEAGRPWCSSAARPTWCSGSSSISPNGGCGPVLCSSPPRL